LAVGQMVVWAADAEQVTVSIGKMELVNVPFPVLGFRIADQSIARVETVGAQQLRVVGVKAGTTDLQVTGEGNVSALFTITVAENINAVLAAVKRDLDAVPEVDVSISLGRVVLKGEVSNIENWKYLQRVIELYKGSIANLTTFRPAPEAMLALKAALEKAGLTVQEQESAKPEPGMISLRFSGNNVFVNGSLYSQNDKERIIQIVGAQDWLTLPKSAVEGATETAAEDPRVKAILNLEVVPLMLEMDACFVGVTDAEEKQIGVNLAKAGLIALDSTSAGFQGNLATRSSGWAGTYSINSGLEGALKFFAGSGPGRFQTAGHMTFKNDSPEWRTYHSGGTMKVRVATRDATSLEDINYGLIMRIKGGLLDANTAAVDVDLELSYPVPVGNDWDLKRNRIETTLNCPLGQTMVLGGMKSLIEQSSNEGVPFLRSVPAISWFFSEKNRVKEDSKVLILLSPRIAGAPIKTAPTRDQTMPTLQESQRPVEERELEKNKRRFFFF
jgi:Flp pilus assembly secretin CpaC